MRQDATSAAYCRVRVTAGCGRPSAVHREFDACNVRFYDQRPLAQRPRELLLYTQISRAALRPGTAAVVKRSASLDCASVSPLGSVVMPGSARLSPPKTA